MVILYDGIFISMDQEDHVYHDSAIVIDNNRIVEIGDKKILLKKYQGCKEKIDCHGRAVFPGFINAHIHTAQSIVRGVAEDLGRAPSYTKLDPQGDDLTDEVSYVYSLLGAAGAMRFGSTFINDNYAHSSASVRAFEQIGIRAMVSERVHDVKFHGLAEGKYEVDPKMGEELLEKNLALFEKYGKKQGKITCCLGPHAPDTCSQELLKKIAKLNETYATPVTTHLAQSNMELRRVKETYGCSSAELLRECGLLNEHLLAAHCVYLDKSSKKMIAESGSHIVHIPEGNSKAGSIAPIRELQDFGANVIIGTDNGAANIIENMRLALVSGRILAHSITQPAPIDILRMVTVSGAKALQRQNELGSIEVGKIADLVIINLDSFHMTPCTNVVGNVVHLGLGTDVETVIIDGKITVRNGKVLGIDEEEVRKDARKIAYYRWQEANPLLEKKYMYLF